MKNFTQSLKKRVVAIAGCMTMLTLSANATTYTAVVSGNFDASTTWGGVTPPQILTADNIVIPSGITVTLNQNATVSGALSTLTVNGSLVSSAGSGLMLTLGSITGNGTLMIDSLVLGLTTGFNFTGNITARKMVSLGSTMSSAANVVVDKELWLKSGIYNLTAGNFSLSNNARIVVDGGIMTVNGGLANLTNTYSVLYTSASATTGVELSGAGLGDIEVNVPAASMVTLSADLDVRGMLTLTSGTLVLNNKNLSFSGNGNFAATGTGTISSTNLSSLSITANNNITGGIRFTSGSNTVNNFTVNMTNNSNSVMLGSSLNVNGQLNLQSGRVNIGANNLTVMSSGSVMGGSANSYVITGTNGTLTMNLAAGGSNTYHVGTSTMYAPAMIAANSGSASGMLSVGVNPSVYVNGTSGTMLSSNQPVVNATWYLASTASTGLNLNMNLMWSAAMEANNFNRSQAYISHYTNSQWDLTASTAAVTASNGLWSMSRANITSLSPFAVMDKDAVTTSVKNIVAKKDIVLYPNPATSTIYFDNHSTSFEATTADIYDLTGHVVKSVQLDRNVNSIAVDELPSGNYTIKFNGNELQAAQRFIKQ